MDYVRQSRKDPEAVAILVEKLIEVKNPSFRNIPDIESRILFFMRKYLPFSAYQWFISTALLNSFNKEKKF